MKKKIAGRIGAAILAASLMMSMAVPAMAESNYTAIAVSTNPTFEKYLIMDQGDTTPNLSFSFTMRPGSKISATSGFMEVIPGPTVTVGDVTYPKIADVVFDPTLGATNFGGELASTIDVGRQDRQNVLFEDGEKYVTQTAEIDFGGADGVKFTEPGIYRYIIEESANEANTNAGITHDDDVDRVLDVYVTDDGSGQLVVSSCAIHKEVYTPHAGNNNGSGDVGQTGASLNDKTDGFTNEMSGRKDLIISNNVTGNQASRDKYFKYNVKFTGGTFNDDDAFVVSLSRTRGSNTMNYGNAEETPIGNDATIYSEMRNPTDVTGKQLTGENGVDFYLNNRQYVVIRGLPADAKYTVTENAEDYKSDPAEGCINTTGNETIGSLAADNKEVRAGFMNTRSGTIPTGVMMAVAPFAVAAVIGGVGVAGIALRKKKREDDE